MALAKLVSGRKGLIVAYFLSNLTCLNLGKVYISVEFFAYFRVKVVNLQLKA